MDWRNRNLSDYLFFISLTIFVSLTFVANIEAIAGVLLPLSYCALVLLGLAFVFRIRQYRATEILVLCGLGAISVYQFIVNDNNTLMKLVLLLSAMRGINVRNCIRYDFILRLLLTIILILLSYMGLAEDMVTADSSRGLRHSLGFSNPNQLGMAVLVICLEALYLMRFKLKLVPTVAVIVAAVWVSVVSGSRSTTLFVFVAVALAALNTIWPERIQKSALLRRLSELAVPALFVLTWIVVAFYQQGRPWAIGINEMTTNRIWHIDMYTQLFSPQILGSDLSSAGMTLDTLYAYLVYGYGVIMTLVFLVAQPLMTRRLWQCGEYGMALIFFTLSLYGLSERLWVCVEYNALMLAFAILLYGERSDSPRRPFSEPGQSFTQSTSGLRYGMVRSRLSEISGKSCTNFR